jgi:hypothetical protein
MINRRYRHRKQSTERERTKISLGRGFGAFIERPVAKLKGRRDL